MLAMLWESAVWRALVGGCIYIVLSAIISHTAIRKNKNDHLFALTYTVVAILYVFAGIVTRVFSPAHLGITTSPSGGDYYVAGIVLIASIIWLFALYLPGTRSEQGSSQLLQDPPGQVALTGLQNEVSLAIFRATITPISGLYIAAWLAPLGNIVLSLGDSRTHRQLANPDQRKLVLFRWSLDWCSSLVFLLTTSIWLAIATRLVARGAFELALHLLNSKKTSAATLDENRENDQ